MTNRAFHSPLATVGINVVIVVVVVVGLGVVVVVVVVVGVGMSKIRETKSRVCCYFGKVIILFVIKICHFS